MNGSRKKILLDRISDSVVERKFPFYRFILKDIHGQIDDFILFEIDKRADYQRKCWEGRDDIIGRNCDE